MTRDVAPRLGFLKPALLHSKFFPALQAPASAPTARAASARAVPARRARLDGTHHHANLPQGANSKMSASDESSAIFCTDTPQQIKFKVSTYAFSGGQAKLEDHRRLGGDLSIDIPYQVHPRGLEAAAPPCLSPPPTSPLPTGGAHRYTPRRQWLTFFQHDDAELKRVGDAYSSGKMASGEIKAELIKVLQPLVAQHQRARALVSDDIVRTFMTPRRLRL